MQIEPTSGGYAPVIGAQSVGSVTSLASVAGRGAGQEEEAVTATPPDNQAELESALRSIQDVVSEENISLKFSRDEQTGAMVMELVDQQSGEPVLQIPSVAQLRLAEVLGKLQGNIFNQKA
jgi:flagellar protein FlaG